MEARIDVGDQPPDAQYERNAGNCTPGHYLDVFNICSQFLIIFTIIMFFKYSRENMTLYHSKRCLTISEKYILNMLINIFLKVNCNTLL